MTSITNLIKNDEIILMDGGVSTEIQKRGVVMDSEVWSGIAHRVSPQIVFQVHEDYIRAGAQVITANTYACARHVLESIKLGNETKKINLEAVLLAKKARDSAAKKDTWIAGSMSSMAPFGSSKEVAEGKKVEGNYRELAETLAEAGVDLIITEMMRDVENAKIVIKAALATGLPVWIGYSAMLANDGKSVLSWRWKDSLPALKFSKLVEDLSPLGGDVAGVMHSQVKDTGPAMDVLSKHWLGPKMAYAETGALEKPDWSFKEICNPKKYANEINTWIKKYSVQIVGGCCGTGPEHIKFLKENIPKSLPPKI